LGKGVALESGEMSGRRSLVVAGFMTERGCWSQGWCLWAVVYSGAFNLLLGALWLHGWGALKISFRLTLNQELTLTRRIRLFNLKQSIATNPKGLLRNVISA